MILKNLLARIISLREGRMRPPRPKATAVKVPSPRLWTQRLCLYQTALPPVPGRLRPWQRAAVPESAQTGAWRHTGCVARRNLRLGDVPQVGTIGGYVEDGNALSSPYYHRQPVCGVARCAGRTETQHRHHQGNYRQCSRRTVHRGGLYIFYIHHANT